MSIETELYDILEVSITATKEEIKKSYRKKALIHHPDKGGKEEDCKQLNAAYEILSNPHKRELYDKHGKMGLRDSGQVSEDILFAMFGDMFRNFSGIFQNVIKQTIYPLKVSLEDLCSRKVCKLKITQNRFCINHETTCLGKICINENSKIFQIHLSPTMENGSKYILANERRNYEPGNFIISIIYKDHPVFLVKGTTLIFKKNITLKEALCGHSFDIKHPSGEIITVTNQDIISPGTVQILSKGLTDEGKMEIQYKILFPKKLTSEQIKILHKNL